MASNFAWDTFLSGRRIKSRYFHIQKAQRELLENDSAWSENLSRGPHGMLNLPDGVLQDAKDFHARKSAQPIQRRSSVAREPSSPPVQDPDDEEGAGARNFWSQSPEEHYHPPPPRPPPQSQPKRKCPPPLFEDEPPSSGVVSEPLDLEPPGFLSQEMGSPVNKAALQATAADLGRPEATPPSAQLPVGTGDSVRQPPPTKRRRVMEEIRAAEGNDVEPEDEEVVRKAVSNPPPGAPDKTQDSLMAKLSTNSLGSQAALESRNQTGSSRAKSDPATYQQRSSFTPSWEGRRQETVARKVVHMGTQIHGPSLAPPPAQRNPTDQSILSATQPSQRLTKLGSARTPYEDYKAAYPDYSENIRKFISACLSVNQLRRDRQLPEFVYDDFVRAYSSDYLLYVSECSRKKADKLLPGIQWYNQYVKDMQYTKKLIRKDNLAAILEVHAEEAHSVRRSLGDSQSTASDSGAEDSDEDMADAPEEEEQDGEPEAIGLDDSEAEDDRAPRGSSVPQIESPALPELSIHPERTHERPAKPNEAAEEQTQGALAEEDYGGDDVVEMDTRGDSPELQGKSLGAVKPPATPKMGSASEMHRALKWSEPFASQEENSRWPHVSDDLHNSVVPRASRSASRLESLRGRDDRPVQQTPATSARQRDTKPRNLSDDDDDEEELAFDPPAPRPPPKKAAQSSPAVKSSPVSAAGARPASTSISLATDKRPLSLQRKVKEPALRRNSNASSLAAGRIHSSASSERSYANVSRSVKRLGETRAERSLNLKAFLQKRLSASTPASTSTSRK